MYGTRGFNPAYTFSRQNSFRIMRFSSHLCIKRCYLILQCMDPYFSFLANYPRPPFPRSPENEKFYAIFICFQPAPPPTSSFYGYRNIHITTYPYLLLSFPLFRISFNLQAFFPVNRSFIRQKIEENYSRFHFSFICCHYKIF